MATTRKRLNRIPKNRISPEAVRAFNAGDVMALQWALRLSPWHVSPLEAVGDCPYPDYVAGGQTWAAVVALREALESA